MLCLVLYLFEIDFSNDQNGRNLEELWIKLQEAWTVEKVGMRLESSRNSEFENLMMNFCKSFTTAYDVDFNSIDEARDFLEKEGHPRVVIKAFKELTMELLPRIEEGKHSKNRDYRYDS